MVILLNLKRFGAVSPSPFLVTGAYRFGGRLDIHCLSLRLRPCWGYRVERLRLVLPQHRGELLPEWGLDHRVVPRLAVTGGHRDGVSDVLSLKLLEVSERGVCPRQGRGVDPRGNRHVLTNDGRASRWNRDNSTRADEGWGPKCERVAFFLGLWPNGY